MTRAVGHGLLLLAAMLLLSACIDGEVEAPRPSTGSPEHPSTTPTVAPAGQSATPAPMGTSTAVAGATPAVTTVATSPATPLAEWNSLGATDLTFALSGGIAGFARRLSIDARARVRVEDQRTGRVREATLAPTDVAALSSLLQDSAIYSQATEQKARCADCFDYTLTLVSASKTYSIDANNVGIDARLRPLVDWLTALQQRELE